MQILTSMFDPSGFGLEIGPSYNPLVPKSSGARIETIDHADQAGLIEKYRNDPSVDVSRIEPVDYVSDGRPMVEVIGHRARYDYIVASHVIEHTPNMLGFLNDCIGLLKPDGCLVLAVPDKRYCFDYFRPTTSTGDILQAYRENRMRHTAGALFDHFAYVTRRGGNITWAPQDRGSFTFCHTLEDAESFVLNYDSAGSYVDCHAWQFTPSSFRLILHDLAAIGMLRLREKEFRDTCGFEFFISLTPGEAHASLDRLALAEAAQLEAAPSLDAQSMDSKAKPMREFEVAQEPEPVVLKLRKKKSVKKFIKRLYGSIQGR
ncbi:MAG: methyltransferase domain-containing protein [Geminicoccaceae bacterium]